MTILGNGFYLGFDAVEASSNRPRVNLIRVNLDWRRIVSRAKPRLKACFDHQLPTFVLHRPALGAAYCTTFNKARSRLERAFTPDQSLQAPAATSEAGSGQSPYSFLPYSEIQRLQSASLYVTRSQAARCF